MKMRQLFSVQPEEILQPKCSKQFMMSTIKYFISTPIILDQYTHSAVCAILRARMIMKQRLEQGDLASSFKLWLLTTVASTAPGSPEAKYIFKGTHSSQANHWVFAVCFSMRQQKKKITLKPTKFKEYCSRILLDCA